MKLNRYLLLMVFLAISIAGWGCQKKATTVTPTPSTAPETEVGKPVTEEKEEQEGETVQPDEKARELSFENIYFDYDRSEIRSDAREILARHARTLADNPNIRLMIEGHCDERGTIEYNLALGERRASSVKRYFTSYGLDAGRFSVISYGKEKPLDPRNTEAAWSKNRRAVFVIQK